jgi:hypothetical protein
MIEGERAIDTGDTVLHLPTGETWVVAFVERDRLSWVGWPEGFAALSDCTLLKKATPDERQKLLEDMANMQTDDMRRRYAKRILSEIATK